jgi:hypothetical protein
MRTVERKIDVAKAFRDENPTTPAVPFACSRASSADLKRRLDEEVQVLVPLDQLPQLAIADTELPWPDLGSLATELLLRINGARTTMSIVTGLSAAPNEGVRELASLVCRGFVRLRPPIDEGRDGDGIASAELSWDSAPE